MARNKDVNVFGKMCSNVVLCIGNDIYKNKQQYSDLKKCSADAKSVFNVFMNQPALKGEKNKSVLICNDVYQYITKEIVLSEWAKIMENVCEDERFIFYFSGHGQNISDEFACVLYDSDFEDKGSYLCFSEIEEALKACKAKEKILIFDACFSGLAATESKGYSITRNGLLKMFEVASGEIVLASSKGEQTSTEKSPSNNSMFTHFLCEALEGKAMKKDSYELSVFAVYEYISKAMLDLCKQYKIDEQVSGIRCVYEGIPILGDFRFVDNEKWYMDNYAQICVDKFRNKNREKLNVLKSYVYEELWDSVKMLILEMVLNSIQHGGVEECEIIVKKQTIEMVDRGKRFNQLKECNCSWGGATLQLEEVNRFPKGDISISYNNREGNHYIFDFGLDIAFDITEQMTFKINRNMLEHRLTMPEWTCKYYLLDADFTGMLSERKMYVEEACNMIPEESVLLLKREDFPKTLVEYYEAIYQKDKKIRFI